MHTATASLKADGFCAELEIARALFAAGDYEDVLRVIGPIIESAEAEARFVALLLKACVQTERKQYVECLETLVEAGPLVDERPDDLRAKYFGQRALAHRNLDNTGAALVDYEAARFWAQSACDELSEARVRNNLARIYSDSDRFDEAIVEVNAAIGIAERLDDRINLGRYYDLKAQILIDHKDFAEALRCSEKAVKLLTSHPSSKEAQSTHGLAMVCLGATYLEEKPQSINAYRARHNAAKVIHVGLDAAMIEQALKRSGGHILAASKLLSISHGVLIKLIEHHNVQRAPKRRRGKSRISS